MVAYSNQTSRRAHPHVCCFWKPRGAYLFQAYLRGWGLFNLEKAMVSVPHKELEYEVEKLKYKKVGGHAAEDQKRNFQLVTKPSQISSHEVLQS